MLTLFRASRSNVLVWILLGLLIVGLAGFGISTGGGGGRTVAQVGDSRIESDALARALDQELRAISGQIGRALPMAEARQFGVDRMVLARLINDATLDDEAARLGLSAGDATVQALVLATPAFRGLDGAFDRQAYAFALERAGLSPGEFEELLRAEATRETVAAGIQAPVAMPATAAGVILGHAGEARRFDWLALDEAHLSAPAGAPDEAELEAFYAERPERYTRPETRRIAYALLDPAAMAETIEVPEDEIRAAYDAAGARYDIPERRILDRIGFGEMGEAAAALARIEAGETDFDAVAAARGLSAADMDQGARAARDLSPEAAEAVFAAEGPGVVGPAATPLGPSLFRINAILAAQATPFEAARDELRRERGLVRARERIAATADVAEDMLAGGATLEEIAAETDFVMGGLTIDATTTGGLAEDPGFRELAASAVEGEETDLVELASGGLAALRVDAIEPQALIPLAELRERVAADWRAEENARLLHALALELAAELEGGLAFADLAARLARAPLAAGPLGRGDILPQAPAGLVEAVFAAGPGAVVVERDAAAGAVALAKVTEIAPFDPAAPGAAELAASVSDQLRAQTAEDMLALYVQALQARAGVTVNQDLFERVLAQFP